MPDRDFVRQIAGYSLTTAEIIYRLPDHPGLLQTFIWQEFDMHPRFPRLSRFLDFWQSNIQGPVHQVRIAHARLIHPREFEFRGAELILH